MLARSLDVPIFLFLASSRFWIGLALQNCPRDELAAYTLTFEAFWTRESFPKQYPEFRPPAHWSKLIGMTHDEGFVLFRVGQFANKGIKTFAETGKADFIASANHVLDEFHAPSIRTGAGKAEVNFFADGNRSMVSLAVKIVPSPDWFIGVDSLPLCSHGKWIDSVTAMADPIDAGTDSGFTFTAPKWATEPQEKITEITSKLPKHPANSFYYPMLRDLPKIASFHMKKKKLYRLVDESETIDSGRGIPKFGSDATVDQAKPAVLESPEPEMKHEKSLKKRRKFKKPRYNNVKCPMESWSQWSSCNATCGEGYSMRTRKGVFPKRKCPILTEEKKCRAFSGCPGKFFKW